MTEHILKTWYSFFPDLLSGAKTAEVRRNDRDYQVGDTLILRERKPVALGEYADTGREARRTVSCVTLLDGLSGIARGYVLLSFGEESE